MKMCASGITLWLLWNYSSADAMRLEVGMSSSKLTALVCVLVSDESLLRTALTTKKHKVHKEYNSLDPHLVTTCIFQLPKNWVLPELSMPFIYTPLRPRAVKIKNERGKNKDSKGIKKTSKQYRRHDLHTRHSFQSTSEVQGGAITKNIKEWSIEN